MASREKGFQAIKTDKAPAYLAFMSQAIKVGNLLFTGGSIPRRPQTLEIPTTFEEQCRLALDNLKATVEAGGTSLANAIKVNVYLNDIKNWARMNELYTQYFTGDPPPVRTTVQVAGMNNNYMIEIEAIVWVP